MSVVNWFQNCIFVWAITRLKGGSINKSLLWIDFKIVFLCEQSQAYKVKCTHCGSCELISKLYFCVSNHKPYGHMEYFFTVVNWFQNCIFVWAITRIEVGKEYDLALWIDFKIVFLCEQSQANF